MVFLYLALALGLTYSGIVAVMFAAQGAMIFPTGTAALSAPRLSATAARFEVQSTDGKRLAGIHFPPQHDPGRQPHVLLGFGGNAWNAGSVASYLHGLFPQAHVVAFHYRGYRPSAGRPSARALLADGPVIYDHVKAHLGIERIIGVGFSLGGCVAAHLAASRDLAGLILVTPFDSLEALAGQLYPWLPVKWFLRHRMSTVDNLSELTIPVAVIAAERDGVVPWRRTDEVRRAARHLVLDRTIKRADHNDLYDYPAFRSAMTEAVVSVASD